MGVWHYKCMKNIQTDRNLSYFNKEDVVCVVGSIICMVVYTKFVEVWAHEDDEYMICVRLRWRCYVTVARIVRTAALRNRRRPHAALAWSCSSASDLQYFAWNLLNVPTVSTGSTEFVALSAAMKMGPFSIMGIWFVVLLAAVMLMVFLSHSTTGPFTILDLREVAASASTNFMPNNVSKVVNT